MASHRIYIREDIEMLLKKDARRRGVTPRDLLRMRVETMSATLEIERLREEIAQCQRIAMSIFQILESLSGELGFLSGATRASIKDKETLTREGALLETHFKRLAAGIKKALSEPQNHE